MRLRATSAGENSDLAPLVPWPNVQSSRDSFNIAGLPPIRSVPLLALALEDTLTATRSLSTRTVRIEAPLPDPPSRSAGDLIRRCDLLRSSFGLIDAIVILCCFGRERASDYPPTLTCNRCFV